MSGETFPTPSELEQFIAGAMPFPHPWAAAIHEAGHCIVSVALGTWPIELSIVPDSTRGSFGHAREISGWGMDHETMAQVLSLAPDALAGYVAARAAGQLAEAIALDEDYDPNDWAHGFLFEARERERRGGGGLSDAEHIASIVRWSELGSAEQDAAFAEIELGVALAIEILGGCWSDVQRVATELYRRRKLDRDHIFDLLEGTPTEERSYRPQQLRARRQA